MRRRAGRAIATAYARAASRPDAPKPAPYPWQRMLTQPMTAAARSENDIDRMQAWAGQSGALAGTAPAGELTRSLWNTATELLSPSVLKL